MNDKMQILTSLKEEFGRWEQLLAGMSKEQLTTPHLPDNLSVKDVVGHLRAWQQRSIARMEAAMDDREPVFPEWPADLDPHAEEDLDAVNAWIQESHREQSWAIVYQNWREGFLRFIELGEAIPEKDMLDAAKYPWLKGYPLVEVMWSSYEHHHDEHFGPLLDWLDNQENVKTAG